jgi:hypothetical protein
MTLKEAVDNCTTPNIKIGSYGGSGWWYAGSRADFFDAADKALKAWHKRGVQKAEANAKEADRLRNIDYETFVRNQRSRSRSSDFSRKAYEEYIQVKNWEYENALQTARKRRKERRKASNDLSERTATKVFLADEAVESVPCTCIVVVGVEDGKFYDCAEAAAAGTPLCFGDTSGRKK